MSPSTGGKRALAPDAFIKLLRAASSVSSRVHQHLATDRLTESQFGVLEALHRRGPLCQRELSGKILKTSGNLTMVVSNLERRGLVRRARDGSDRRIVMVRLTPAGERLIHRVYPRQLQAIEREMALLSEDQQQQLGALCKTLGLGQEEQQRAAITQRNRIIAGAGQTVPGHERLTTNQKEV